jgi:sec-independent protein translocase protein TatA
MISFTHILLIILICVLLFGPNKLPAVGKSVGEGFRQLKKGIHGESDIDVTDSVKRIDDEKDS